MLKNDTLWKGIIEDFYDDFLRFFISNADELFDLEREPVPVDKELSSLSAMTMPQSPKYVDKLLKVFIRQGEEDHFLLHVEVQGYRDNDFERRMFQYFYRIMDHYQKPVAAIAILTDPHEHFRPGNYRYTYQWGVASYEYVVYKVLDQQEEVLMKNGNPFAVIILTVLLSLQLGKASDAEILRMKEKIARHILERQLPNRKQLLLLAFLNGYVPFKNPSYDNKFGQLIDSLTNKKGTMGLIELIAEQKRQEGMEKGRKEGMQQGRKEGMQDRNRAFISYLIRNSNLSVADIAKEVGVARAFVQKVRKNLQVAA